MIKRDIARTFPDHSFFKDKDGIGQGTLFNVIKVISMFMFTRIPLINACLRQTSYSNVTTKPHHVNSMHVPEVENIFM